MSNTAPIIIKKNRFGNYEHLETGFVFNRETKSVIGVQVINIVRELNADDLALAKNYKFKVKRKICNGG